MNEHIPPTQDEILHHIDSRYGKQFSVVVDGPLIKMRQGLNRGANIRLRPEGIEALPRTFLDDNGKAIISATGTACGMLVILGMLMFSPEAAAATDRVRPRGIAYMVAGGFALGAFIGGCAAGVAVILMSPKKAVDANRSFARDLNAWLDKETK